MADSLSFSILPKDASLAESFDVFLCNGYSLPSFAIKFLKEHSSSFLAREDDVYVISYPKTGTTWTQEIVYLIHTDLDFEKAKSKSLFERFPYVEHASTNVNGVINMVPPRLIKSHLPYSLLPMDIKKKKSKIIYVTRNPKDVVVSYYHFACWLRETNYKGSFDQFFKRFISNRVTYSSFFQHNLEFWQHRNDNNILFLFYEDLHKDLAGNIVKIAEFLDKSLSDDEVERIMDHCSFKSMAKNEKVGPSENAGKEGESRKFFRKGVAGDWKNCLSDEQSSIIDQLVSDTFADTGLSYTYE